MKYNRGNVFMCRLFLKLYFFFNLKNIPLLHCNPCREWYRSQVRIVIWSDIHWAERRHLLPSLAEGMLAPGWNMYIYKLILLRKMSLDYSLTMAIRMKAYYWQTDFLGLQVFFHVFKKLKWIKHRRQEFYLPGTLEMIFLTVCYPRVQHVMNKALCSAVYHS